MCVANILLKYINEAKQVYPPQEVPGKTWERIQSNIIPRTTNETKTRRKRTMKQFLTDERDLTANNYYQERNF